MYHNFIACEKTTTILSFTISLVLKTIANQKRPHDKKVQAVDVENSKKKKKFLSQYFYEEKKNCNFIFFWIKQKTKI